MRTRVFLLTPVHFAFVAICSVVGSQAVAQTTAGQSAADALLEEVVVTARRREESLEDLPLSVVALSADALLFRLNTYGANKPHPAATNTMFFRMY